MSAAQVACRPTCRASCPPAAPIRQSAASSSIASSRSGARRPSRAACGTAANRVPPPRRLLCRAAAEEAPADVEEEEEESDDQLTWQDFVERVVVEERQSGAGPREDLLTVPKQRGLRTWQPGETEEAHHAEDEEQRQQQGAADAAASEAGDAPTYEELLARLPGLQRMMRDAAQERSGLVKAPEQDPWTPDRPFRYPRKPEPELSEWDLRAKMEKRRRQQREREAWDAARAAVGEYPSLGADWRTDVRCQHTGDPTDPSYREWTHTEIWDLITEGGRNADPRDVAVWVRNPDEIADAPHQGAEYRMDPEEYFESIGALIREEDLAAIAGSAGVGRDGEDGAEAALLAAEFSDFDDELGDFDADYGAGAGDDDDEF